MRHLVLLLLVLPSLLIAQSDFKVMSADGRSKVFLDTWKVASPGQKLPGTSKVQVVNGGYIGLIHVSGQTVMMNKQGEHDLAGTMGSLNSGSNTYSQKYLKYLGDKMEGQSGGAKYSSTGAYEHGQSSNPRGSGGGGVSENSQFTRGLESSDSPIGVPSLSFGKKRKRGKGDKQAEASEEGGGSGYAALHQLPADVVALPGEALPLPFTGVLSGEYELVSLFEETVATAAYNDSILAFSSVEAEAGALLLLRSRELAQEVKVRFPSEDQIEALKTEREALLVELEGKTGLIQLALPAFYEQNGMLLQAWLAYEELAASNQELFGPALEDFKGRNNLY